MSNTVLKAVAAAIVLSSSTAYAEQTAELIVTANRSAQYLDETLSAVTVIKRDEIEASQAADLNQLLDGLAGISISNSGGLGKQSDIHVRGSNGGHLLVLVDGVRIGSATLGAAAIQDLPLSQIERIEIVRGPRSAVYGADAIGGVMQVFTRRGGEQAQRNLHIEGGSEGHRRLGAGLSGARGDSRYSLQLSSLRNDGLNAAIGNNPDLDGYANDSLSARLDQRIGAMDLGLNLLHSQGENHYDGWTSGADYRSDFRQQSLGLNLDFAAGEGWESRLQLGSNRDESENFRDGADDGRFNTRRLQAAWLNDIELNDDLLVLGLEHMTETVSGSSNYSVDSRRNNALFAEWQGQIGIHELQAGVRHDRSDSYGNNSTANLEVAHLMRNGMRASVAYGTAFKAPSFNDLYYLDPWGSNGNPELEPERSRSLELGLRGWEGNWSLRLYRNEIDNLIQWSEVAPWTWQPQNVAQARINGVEFEWRGELWGWQNRLDLSWLDPRDADSDLLLARRPQQSARLELGRVLGQVDTRIGLNARGHSYDDAANSTRLPGYALLDLRIAYPLAPTWRLELRGDNLLDQQHRSVDGYNSSPRSFFLGLRYED